MLWCESKIDRRFVALHGAENLEISIKLLLLICPNVEVFLLLEVQSFLFLPNELVKSQLGTSKLEFQIISGTDTYRFRVRNSSLSGDNILNINGIAT